MYVENDTLLWHFENMPIGTTFFLGYNTFRKVSPNTIQVIEYVTYTLEYNCWWVPDSYFPEKWTVNLEYFVDTIEKWYGNISPEVKQSKSGIRSMLIDRFRHGYYK